MKISRQIFKCNIINVLASFKFEGRSIKSRKKSALSIGNRTYLKNKKKNKIIMQLKKKKKKTFFPGYPIE